MGALFEVNERTTMILNVKFYDEDGALVVPNSGTYKIDDIGSGTAVLASTNIVGIGSSTDLTITAAQNKMVSETNQYERKRVTVVALYSGSTKQVTDEYDYFVKNLTGVTT